MTVLKATSAKVKHPSAQGVQQAINQTVTEPSASFVHLAKSTLKRVELVLFVLRSLTQTRNGYLASSLTR